MSKVAVLATAFGQVGLSGDFGGTWFMSQLVGSAKARELYFLSERVDADEALRLGLANWLSEPEELEERSLAIAGRLAGGAGVAFRYMKENINRALAGTLEDNLDIEATHHIHCASTDDHREAARAFVEKRAPAFVGR